MKAIEHFKTVCHHKYLVAKGCFAVGLYWQGLTHDLSKFSPAEFCVGAKYFQGTRSPNNAEREAIGYSSAWLHHKGRNKHHFEYWIDYGAEYGGPLFHPAKMPVRYLVEMFMDRIAASKTYLKDKYTDDAALKYFLKGKGVLMHPKTRKQLYILLKMLADNGEEKTFAYIRHHILNKKIERR
ncbi:MAG: DUF5662 family protein [Lachnospiraceae bacterium]|nr:DUF5662 family protein [Lachnospiraceae bacterium]